jgi:hypothetical protein
MSKFREGQTVRITWPNGTIIEGVLNRSLYVDCPPSGYAFYVEEGAYTRDGRTVVVLSEPRPDEPTGWGAIVEAASKSFPNKRRVYLRDNMSYTKIYWRSTLGTTPWSELVDPVVLCSGWTPKCTCEERLSMHKESCPISSGC